MTSLYVESFRTGLLSDKVAKAREHLISCDLCPRNCGADRLGGELGICRGGARAEISSAAPHFGEEPPLTGWSGSGTVFLTHCSLRCIFCQNHDISYGGAGREVSAGELAAVMINLQSLGCHNINFVTPTHYLPQILEAVDEAACGGLEIPLVWNCSGYERAEILKLLEGVVDIYMPDIKFSGAEPAARYCDAADYFERARESLLEMHRQVGDLEIGTDGLATRGLLVRHLVLPGGIAGTREVAAFLARDISKNTYLNVMDQYRPCFRAGEHPEINRMVTSEEYDEALRAVAEAGLGRGFV